MTTTEDRTDIGPPLFPDSSVLPIAEAMAAVLLALHGVPKAGRNTSQNYSFRGIDDMRTALRPLLGRFGVSPRIKTLSLEREQRQTKKGDTLWVVHVHLEMRFVASDGSFDVSDAYGEGSDSADKATSKAYTMAEKTILEKVFQISSGDSVDPDATGEESNPAEEAPDWFVENGWSGEPQFREWRERFIERMKERSGLADRFKAQFGSFNQRFTAAEAQSRQAWLEEHDVEDPPEPSEADRKAAAARQESPEQAPIDCPHDYGEDDSNFTCVLCGEATPF